MNPNFIRFYIWKHSFRFHVTILAAILKKYATVFIVFYIFDIYIFYFIWIDTSFVFIFLKVELIYIRFGFSAAILATILENMQLMLLFSTYLISICSFISYESTLYSSLYLKAEMRYIRIIFSAAILAAILNFVIFLY